MVPSTTVSPSITSYSIDPIKAVTPGKMFVYVKNGKIDLYAFDRVNGTVRAFFHSTAHFHGLYYNQNSIFAASVTAIYTNRKGSKPISFEKAKSFFVCKMKDFIVQTINSIGRINYQAGHLIDDKFGSGHLSDPSNYSNGCLDNYVPMIYFYNSPLKEYLVNPYKNEGARLVALTDYLEFPIYTPNPPLITDQTKSPHRIPVALTLVQIHQGEKGKEFAGVYCFPNNNFNYDVLRYLKRTTLSAAIAPLFKIRNCFQPLLYPAVRYENRAAQEEKETESFHLMNSIVHINEAGSKLIYEMFSQFNKYGSVDPSCFLEEKALSIISENPQNASAIKFVFASFAKFILSYGLSNIIKTEILDVKARMLFLNSYRDTKNNYSRFLNQRWELHLPDWVDRVIENLNEDDFDEDSLIEQAINLKKCIEEVLESEQFEYLNRCCNFEVVGYQEFIDSMDASYKDVLVQFKERQDDFSLEQLISLAKVLLDQSEIEFPEEGADETIYEDEEQFSDALDNFQRFTEVFKAMHKKWSESKDNLFTAEILFFYFQAEDRIQFFIEFCFEDNIKDEIDYFNSLYPSIVFIKPLFIDN